ncbi:MAG: deoxyribonuclease IV [Candidatus Thermoplasmatota archaeon]|nr:deoxyribonuclease IV [Candidatus Thermoplasmatota archaeon]
MAELKFGPAGVPLCAKKRDTLTGIEECARLGLEALEVEFVRGVRMSVETALDCGKIASELGIALSAHAPYFINLASEDKIKRKKSMSFVLETAKIANALKAKYVVFHPGFYGKKSKEECYQLVKECIEEIVDTINKSKWDVLLAPETMGRQSQFGTLDETLKICEELDGVVPTIDFAHIHARTNGSLKTSKDFDRILDTIEKRLKLKELHTHFTGVEYKAGNEKKHLVLEKGDLKFEYLATALESRKLEVTIISESPILEKDALEMKRIWEKL